MSKALDVVVVLWLLSSTGFAQSDAALVRTIEAAADPHTLDRIPPTAELAAALRDRADTLFQAGDYEKALRLNLAAATVAVHADERREAARAYRALGLCYRRMGRQQESLRANEDGLAYSRAAFDPALSADLYRGVGLAQRALGHNTAALEAYRQSIASCEQANDRECALKSTVNLGGIYSLMGDFRQAAEVLYSGWTEAHRLGNPLESGLLNNLAVVYGSQGDNQSAQSYFERALALCRARHDRTDVAIALANLVPFYRLENATRARQAAEEGLRLAGDANQGRIGAGLLLELARIELAEHHYDAALADLTESLRRFQDLGQRAAVAESQAEIAVVHAAMRHDEEALAWAARAQTEARECGSVPALSRALDIAGQVLRRTGRSEEARAAFEEEVSLYEAARGALAGGETAEVPFLSSRTAPYYGLMEMAVEGRRFDGALESLEAAKARLLVDILESGRADLSKFMTESERREEQRFTAAVDRATAAHGARDAAEKELAVFHTALYAAHPELKLRRARFAPFRKEDAAGLLTDPHTALVEFALSDDQLFAFVLTRTPGHAPSLSVTRTEWKAADATAEVEAFRRSLGERKLAYRDQAGALYRRIFAPIAGLLHGKTVVGIVPDGVLWGAPLQALVQPDGRFFLEDHAVFYAPSLTALREIGQRRSPPARNGGALLALGAPALGHFAGALPPLPDSEREVSQVAELYGAAPNAVYTGADARKSVWLAEAPRRQVLHLATHGVLNTNNPLYSYLVLSDGVMEAREILDMDLHAQLVVLSACETGLGSVASGEGLIGIGWAFLVAGTPAAVVSQWKVDSHSTGELMLEFHRAYHADGLAVARALQRAALHTMKTPAYRHPFYWAGFVVMGAGN